jgi:tripartite ATP-independent transporter DctP family solute receptor
MAPVLLAAVVMLPAGCEQAETGAGPRIVKLGTVLPESHATVKAMKFFQDRLGELSSGRMKVVLFPSSQLGSADEMIDGCRTGDIEMAQVSAAVLAEYVPLANALSMPFIWRDAEHQARVLDGDAVAPIASSARELDLEVLGYLDAGTRNITTIQGPIEKPEDLHGLKIRVMDARLMVDSINALGASAVAMNQGEVFTALQQGVLDGWENNPQTIVTFRMYETGCKHFAWTRHFSIPDLFIASRPFMERLTSQERDWLLKAVEESIHKQREIWRDEEQKALAHMAEKGMKINAVEGEPFRRRVLPIYERYYQRHGEEFRILCEHIRSAM